MGESVYNYVFAFFLAAVLTVLWAPRAISFCRSWNLMDYPGERKAHKEPMPLAGGLLLFPVILAGFSLPLWGDQRLPYVFFAVLIVFTVGILDDLRGVAYSTKFFAQVTAALLVVQCGIRINLLHFGIFGNLSSSEENLFSVLLTVFWIVGLTNAVNLIDGLDGLATALSLNAFLGIGAIAFLQGQTALVLFCLVVSGALFGLLKFNLHPARIFLGDSGSLLLGFSVAVIAIIQSAKTTTLMVLLIPILFLAIPMVDTSLAFVRRVSSGNNPFKPDRGHLHHRLLDLNFTPRQTLIYFLAFSFFLGQIAIHLSHRRSLYALTVSLLLVALMIIIIRTLNVYNFNAKIKTVNTKLRSFGKLDGKRPDIRGVYNGTLAAIILMLIFNLGLAAFYVEAGRGVFLAMTLLLPLLAIPDLMDRTENGFARPMFFSNGVIFFLILTMNLSLVLRYQTGFPVEQWLLLSFLLMFIAWFLAARILKGRFSIFLLDPMDFICLNMAGLIIAVFNYSRGIYAPVPLFLILLNTFLLFFIFRILINNTHATFGMRKAYAAMPVILVIAVLFLN
ncbi:putative undecaprenyl-phosphate N-acetylglucosaminyl 1-phosphate transferase [bacterium BMS3Abin14]|nr:putative undecaprenyl-phosphate N-acetylglucosaminyl 1-phosphate transferase [bacterium BMS3Abin14]